MKRSRRRSAGVTYVETMAALALIGTGLAVSGDVLVHGRAIDRGIDRGAERLGAAERLMEETLAAPFAELGPRSLRLPPEETGGEPGFTATVAVTARGPALKEVVVRVRDGEARATTLHAVAAPWRVAP